MHVDDVSLNRESGEVNPAGRVRRMLRHLSVM
jgi:hypothetical protein